MGRDDDAEIRAFLDDFNRAWQAGRSGSLVDAFDPNMVTLPPGSTARVEGRDALLRSLDAFRTVATIRHFETRDVQVDVFGDTAVAVFRFDITYAMDGKDCDEAGRELFVLTRTDGRWRGVFRTQWPIEPAH